MKIIKTNGIILVENNMGDFDKMVTILTPGYGKISCAAKGARRPKSLLLAGTQFLCFGEYVLYKGTNAYNINSSEIIEVFYKIRTDLEKINYASYITKIILDVTNENQNSYKILQLFLNTLYVISEKDKDLDLVVAIFKIRLISILGFTPNIKCCTNCGKTEEIGYFSFKDSGIKCIDCGKYDKSSIQISRDTINVLKYIIYCNPQKLFSFNISDNIKKELEIIAKLYINEKLEKEYKLEKLF